VLNIENSDHYISSQNVNDEADWSLEQGLWSLGNTPLAGIDEAGRGALAGPVVVAAVILPYGWHPYRDSKRVSPKRRDIWEKRIRDEAVAWGIGISEAADIDRLNILGATHLAAERAIARLNVAPGGLITDYLFLRFPAPVIARPKADGVSLQVAAASILAKTYRDRLLGSLGCAYQGYALQRNMGYATPDHLLALRERGPTACHRRSFRPVREATGFSH
jgi:ribonuclease HII